MKDTEIINFYNNLDQYAKDKIDRQLIDLTNAKKESRNYCIKVCPKCGAVNPKTAVPFLCTAVGKQICSFDSPLLEAEPPRFLGFKLSIFSPLCEFSTYFSSSSISPETTVRSSS
ncbi:hypothetical protein CGK76_10595 [Erysipelotrichaceae bacterium 7770_A6]|nr:hypothetical protein [Erysipelotrichaceae bacterium 7770_A6]